MFENFTAQARRTIAIAGALAEAASDPQAGTGHLLVAFMYEPGSSAWTTLTSLGLTTCSVRDAAEAAIAGIPPGARTCKQPMSPRLHTVLQDATADAITAGTCTSTGHLLLSAVRDRNLAWELAGNHATAVTALGSLGITPAQVRDVTVAVMDGTVPHVITSNGEPDMRDPVVARKEILVRLDTLEQRLVEHMGDTLEVRRRLGLVDLRVVP